MPAVGGTPETENRGGNGFDQRGVLRQDATANQQAGPQSRQESIRIRGPPEGCRGPRPEENVEGINGHQRRTDRKERRDEREHH